MGYDIAVIMLASANNFAYALPDEALASPPMSDADKPTTKVDPTMAIVLVCLLSAFFMICVVSAYFRHYAERQLRIAASTTHGSETGSMRSVVLGLDPAMISEFQSFLYSSVKGIKVGETVLECAVCLNEFQDNETLRLLPKCSHLFHRDCIDTWLVSHVTCPVCRADLVLRLEDDVTDQSLHCPADPEIDCASTEFLLPVEESKHNISLTTEMPRSHSTGHSVVQPIDNLERYTLRLRNDERGIFVNLVTSLPTSPNIVFPVTYRSISVGSTRRLDYVRYERSINERPRGETSRGGSRDSHVDNNGIHPSQMLS